MGRRAEEKLQKYYQNFTIKINLYYYLLDDGEETELATLVETVRSSQQNQHQQSVIAISRMQIQQRRKHTRKPIKRIHLDKPLNV